MSILVYGLSLLLAAFIIHLIIWRIKLPKNQTVVLLAIFFIVLILGITIFAVCKNSLSIFGLKAPYTLGGYFYMILFYLPVAVAYITTYSAIEVDSPSLVMVMNIAKAGKEGMAKSTFEKDMNDELLIEPRLKDLVTAGMALKDEKGRYVITQKGRNILGIFMFYRKILERKEKGG